MELKRGDIIKVHLVNCNKRPSELYNVIEVERTLPFIDDNNPRNCGINIIGKRLLCNYKLDNFQNKFPTVSYLILPHIKCIKIDDINVVYDEIMIEKL